MLTRDCLLVQVLRKTRTAPKEPSLRAAPAARVPTALPHKRRRRRRFRRPQVALQQAFSFPALTLTKRFPGISDLIVWTSHRLWASSLREACKWRSSRWPMCSENSTGRYTIRLDTDIDIIDEITTIAGVCAIVHIVNQVK